MKVLMIEPMKPPREVQIEPGLEPLQKAVGGDIQELCPFIDPVAIIANDEGKIIGLPANRALRDHEGRVYDILCGTFLIAGIEGEHFTSHSPEMMWKYKKVFKDPERFFKIGDKVIAVPFQASGCNRKTEHKKRATEAR
jgi:hypothetical protein